MPPAPKKQESSSESGSSEDKSSTSKESKKSGSITSPELKIKGKKSTKAGETETTGKTIPSKKTTVGRSSSAVLRTIIRAKTAKISRSLSEKFGKATSSKPVVKKSKAGPGVSTDRVGKSGKKRSSGKKSSSSPKPITVSEDSEKSSNHPLDESESEPKSASKKETSEKLPELLPSGETTGFDTNKKTIPSGRSGSSTSQPPLVPIEEPRKVSKSIEPTRKESATSQTPLTEVTKKVSKEPVKKESGTSQTTEKSIPKKTSDMSIDISLAKKRTPSLRFQPSPEKASSKPLIKQASIPKKVESSPLRFSIKKPTMRGKGKSVAKSILISRNRSDKSPDTPDTLESGPETDETQRTTRGKSRRSSNLRSKKKLKPLTIDLPPGVKIESIDAIKAINENRENNSAARIEYFDEFPKNRTRFPFSRGNTQLATVREQDSWRNQKTGLLRINKEIFGKHFFDVIKILRTGEKIELIFIKSDKHSRNILENSVGWLSCKRFGVNRIFDLSETLSNNLTQKALFVYLINLHRISDQQFKMFTTDLRERSYSDCYVFLTHPIDPCGQFVSKRVGVIEKITQDIGLHPPIIVGAFAAYNPWIGLFNGESAHLKYISYFASRSRRSSSVYDHQRFLTVTIAFRLVNFFEQMNQFPHIYYYDAPWHSLNRDIAALFNCGLTSLARKRKTNTNTTGYRKDFTLIVLDRSYDMVTPILHSEDIQSFIGQELKRYDINIESDFLSPTFRNFPIDRATTKLQEIVKLVRGREHRMTLKQRSRSSKLINDCNYLCERVIHRFKCGYGRILAYERHVLGTVPENIEQFRRADEEDKLNFLPCDLMRLVMIMCATKNKSKKEALRLIGSNNLTSAHHKLIQDYKKLVRKIQKLAPTSNLTYPMLQKVVYKYFNGVLPENEFPSVGSKRVGPTSRPKLIIFMLGGLSYNEIHLGGSRGTRDQPVTLLSTDLLSAQSFLTQLFPTTEMAERAIFSQRANR